MADNSKKLSELPIASNVVSTDRLIVLYNAISNSSVANGSPSARTIDVPSFANSVKHLIVKNTAPTTSKGNSGDKAGTLAANSTYMFYCTTNYTDGVADIWIRTSWSNSTW